MATTKWRITRQNKTRYDNTRELRALLIHQLVLVCWRAVPQTISFYNPEPSYLEMPRHGCTAVLLQRCQVYIVACCNAARFACNTAGSALLHAATLRHGSTIGPYFCVVGSRPWHYPLFKRHLPDGAGLLGYRWWNRLTKSWAWTRFLVGSQVALEGG
jgi:hypothetical protein